MVSLTCGKWVLIEIHLDTSVLSTLFNARNPEKQELTKEFFSRIDVHHFGPANSHVVKPLLDLKELLRLGDWTLSASLDSCHISYNY